MTDIKILRKEELDEESIKLIALSEMIEKTFIYPYHPETHEAIGCIDTIKIGNIIINNHIDDCVTHIDPEFIKSGYDSKKGYRITPVFHPDIQKWTYEEDHRNFRYDVNHEKIRVSYHYQQTHYYLPLEGDESWDDRKECDKLGPLPEGAETEFHSKESMIDRITSINKTMYDSIYVHVLKRIFNDDDIDTLITSYIMNMPVFKQGEEEYDTRWYCRCGYTESSIKFYYYMNILNRAIQVVDNEQKYLYNKVLAPIMIGMNTTNMQKCIDEIKDIRILLDSINACFVYLNVKIHSHTYKEIYTIFKFMKNITHSYEQYIDFYENMILPEVWNTTYGIGDNNE